MATATSTPTTSAGSNRHPCAATSLAAAKEPMPASAYWASESWPV